MNASSNLGLRPAQTSAGLSGEQPQNVWIVIAAYNEGSRLATTLKSLANCGSVVVVDDGSRDDTFEVACSFPVWVLQHPLNCGQGAALQTGIDFALSQGADAVITFDADGQHDPAELSQMLQPVVSGQVDVALGSRFLGSTQNMPWSRRILLMLAIWFTRLTNGLALTDTHNGFRALSRSAAQQIRIRQPRMAHASEILDQIAKHRLRYVEIPVTVRYHADTLAKGQSSWDAFRITGHLLAGRFWQ
ncbi:Undecaprenyl-phosphate mannosyltransferase [Roseimaritima multifibrata]|uniref:Undecaprenyl-phosphate mannosyltransferase n=1 Tax=Roseimaritima multifibrata TaxID=1930274 RepID=A0A517MA06_9BACT|nr:glycosyltransferase family 2 protein [Roseimaritima multifibrata]QDS91723.1 Undecaprenyl-phosphate mannosyltransferase [Roseimaritima multifibrata]